MKILKNILFIISILVISFSSGQEHKKVEINVSNSFKKTIEEAAPAEEYCFYALKESYPKSIEEMNKTKLFVCGEIKAQADVVVMMASLDDYNSPLFNSIHRYLINPNILSGKMVTSENVTITPKSGKSIKFPLERAVYGKDTSIDTLIKQCSVEMQKINNSVLLIGRNVDSEVLSLMVEIIFK